MENLKFIKTFMTIIDEGSIVKAAQKLNITKAAASKHLIDLENQMNTQLIRRTTRSLILTDVGQLYYEAVCKVFHALNDANSIITHKKPIGLLRVVSHRHFGEKYIVNHIKTFTDMYPDLKLDLELADRFPDLDKENIDVLCGAGDEGPENLVRKKISSAKQVICASPDYLLRFGTPKTVADLQQHRYITHSFREPDNILTINKQNIIIDYFIRLNDAQSMMQCALQGIGIIKIYKYFVSKYLKKGQLIELLKNYSEPEKPIYIYYPYQRIAQPKIRVFIDFIAKNIVKENDFH